MIRNFVIIAHIDHGKSTLADRFLELTGTVEKRKMREQYLDAHPLEREKGITIKMTPVRMNWRGCVLNLIDTPGHVDFSYEVSRALAAAEGAVLLVDASQGVQAQTVANLHLARKEGLKIIPAANKIDLAQAEVAKTEEEIRLLLPEAEKIFRVSAKTGEGVEELLNAVMGAVPPPAGEETADLRALIFDSVYDSYAGVIAYVRVFDGKIRKGGKIRFVASGVDAEAMDVGIFSPERTPKPELNCGEIGYIATGVKEPEKVRVGDTITASGKKEVRPLAGYQEPKPMVFASVFPENQNDYEILRDSFKKLKLNDAAVCFEPEESGALGRGFRAGFLGMLHMEITAERLKREYGLKIIFSNPSVAFRARTLRGQILEIRSAHKMPDASEIVFIEEPVCRAEIIVPPQFMGGLTSLINEREGKIASAENFGPNRIRAVFEAPLREIIVDFYDELKSATRGFASMVYEVAGYREGNLARLDVLVAGEKVGVFSEIVPKERAYDIGRKKILKLKEILPRQLFAVPIQAQVEGRIIARETIPAARKDVTGYLYGGDRTRKMKLWKKQQKGKKRLKESGRVEIPPEVFLKMLQR